MEEFRTVIEKHHAILYKIGRSYTRNGADFDDLYQEMLIQIHDSMKAFRNESRLSTWIYRVALNTALTFHRNDKKKSRLLQMDDLKQLSEPESDTQGTEARERNIELLYECINELPKADRAIVLLHLEGKSYEEISEIIGISKSNTGVKIMRIKKRLQELLLEKGYERS